MRKFRRQVWLWMVAIAWAAKLSFGQEPKPFEGVMQYALSYYDESGRAVERSLIRVMATPQRVLIPDMRKISIFDTNAPRGLDSILVRNDMGDVLVYGKEIDAYWFKGMELRLLGLAMKATPLSDTPVDMSEPQYGGRFTVRDFKTKLYRYLGENGFRFELYLTDDYTVNWGLVGGAWLFGSGGLSVEGLDAFLDEGLVPARIEAFEGRTKVMSVNLMRMDSMAIDKRSVAKPRGKILHSTKDVLWELVR
ncbi:MAG: hypothetical protein AAGB46_11400 [Verrucomicrobiota bacterium]